MRLNLSADDVLTTTRSVRKRLDFERPVEREVLLECLDIALQAPTGSNRQGWQWLFVEDDEKKRALRDIYLENFTMYRAVPGPEYEAGDPRAERIDKVMDVTIAREVQRLERRLLVLATVGSAGPFIGLFGSMKVSQKRTVMSRAAQ